MSSRAIGIRRGVGDGVWRGQLALVGALLGLAVFAWIITAQRMRGMDGGPGTDLGTLGFYLTAWVVMMAAMMFPSIAPMVLAYARISPRMHGACMGRATTAVFVAGYLVSWTGFGLAGYGLFVGARSLAGHTLAWQQAGRYVAGGVIVLAALYQLTPAKDACLRRCRAPFAFLTDEWREGLRGALVMGMRHGAWCIGCCWGLMAALFAVGVMSVGWMVLVASLIAIEKLTPWPRPANYAIAAVLIALGLGVALAPSQVPGLTLPDSPAATHTMRSMKAMDAPARTHARPKTPGMRGMAATRGH